MNQKESDQKSDWKKNIWAIGFNILAVVFLLGTGYLIFFGKKDISDGSGWVLFACSALCGLIGNLDKIENIKISRDGIETKIREVDRVVDEAKSVLAELHKFSEMTGAMLINMLSGEGRLGGRPHKDIEAERIRILESLKSIGLDDEAIKKVAAADRKWVAIDYANGIIKMLQKSTQCSQEQRKALDDMLGLWNNEEYRPTPDELLERMNDHGITDSEVLELVKDYKYYMENGKHRRKDVWLDRQRWWTK